MRIRTKPSKLAISIGLTVGALLAFWQPESSMALVVNIVTTHVWVWLDELEAHFQWVRWKRKYRRWCACQSRRPTGPVIKG